GTFAVHKTPCARSGGPPADERVTVGVQYAPTDASVPAERPRSKKFGGDMPPRRPESRLICEMSTSRSGARDGSGRSTTARTIGEVAADAPAARPSVTTIAAVKSGERPNPRSA